METENECFICHTGDVLNMELYLRRIPSMTTPYIRFFNSMVDTEFVEIVRFILGNNFNVTS